MGVGLEIDQNEKILGVIGGVFLEGGFSQKNRKKLRIVFLYIFTQITSGKFQPHLPVRELRSYE